MVLWKRPYDGLIVANVMELFACEKLPIFVIG